MTHNGVFAHNDVCRLTESAKPNMVIISITNHIQEQWDVLFIIFLESN